MELFSNHDVIIRSNGAMMVWIQSLIRIYHINYFVLEMKKCSRTNCKAVPMSMC